jgi:hypothetical protein
MSVMRGEVSEMMMMEDAFFTRESIGHRRDSLRGPPVVGNKYLLILTRALILSPYFDTCFKSKWMCRKDNLWTYVQRLPVSTTFHFSVVGIFFKFGVGVFGFVVVVQ